MQEPPRAPDVRKRAGRLPSAAIRLSPFVLFLLTPLLVYPWSFVRAGLLDGGDDALSNLPLLIHSARALLRLEVFWTPSLWLGTPLLDEPEFGVLYLPRLLLLAMPAVPAFTVYVVAHYALAQSGLYLYARGLGVSRAAGTFGALVYGFSGFMLGHRGHTMYLVAGAWAPFVLFFLRRVELREGRANRNILGAALSFAALPLSGAVQLTVYLGVTVLAVTGFVAIAERRREPVVSACLALCGGSLIAMPQILPSLGFVSELVAQPRAGFDFAVALSYDPRLLPLLVVPHDPLIAAELYSRIGAFAAVIGFVALFRARGTVVRAWALVAIAAAVLMLGWHVPFLSQLLHHLPVVGVFRGPARHNFELGLATSVLGALGFDAVFAAPSIAGEGGASRSRAARAVAVALTFAAVLSVAFVACARRLAESHPVLDQAKALLTVLRGGWVVVAAVALGLAVVSVALGRTRLRHVAAVLVVVAPLVEARLSTGLMDRIWPDYSAELTRATRTLVPESTAGAVRVLPPPATVAGLEALADNGAALVPGVQNLIGYASMANADAASMFDLDMHGHPRAPADLAWSRLPSLFGVSRLILPEAICAPLDVIAPSDRASSPCAEAADGPRTPGAPAQLACTVSLTAGVSRFAAELVPGAPRAGVRAGNVQVQATGRGFELGYRRTLALSVAREEYRRKWFFKRHVPQHGALALFPSGNHAADLKSFEIIREELVPIAELPRGVADVPVHAPDWLSVPPTKHNYDLPRLLMDLAVRAPEPPDRAVAVDLYAPRFDPVSGQMGVEPRDIYPWFTRHAAFVRPPPLPEGVSLRLLYDGSEPVDVKSATLHAGKRTTFLHVPGEALSGRGFQAESGLHLEPGGVALMTYHLPTRPVTVTVDARVTGDGSPLSFGVGYEPLLDLRGADRVVPRVRRGTVRLSYTVDTPAEATELELHAHTPPSGGLQLTRLAATSACTLRRYRPIAPLRDGLSVFANDDAMPRAYAVGAVRAVTGVEEARDVLRDDPAYDPRSTALVEGLGAPPPLAQGTVESAEFSGERVEVRVAVPAGRATFLVVNDRFHPRWRATLDGRETPIYRTNGLVRGLVVPGGSHVVVMSFSPPWTALLGAILAMAGVVLCLVAPALPVAKDAVAESPPAA